MCITAFIVSFAVLISELVRRLKEKGASNSTGASNFLHSLLSHRLSEDIGKRKELERVNTTFSSYKTRLSLLSP